MPLTIQQQRTKQSLINGSCIAWILDNNFQTERLEAFEFTKHRFLIDYMADEHPDICATKCAQVGATLAETFDDFHLAGIKKLNVIHTLQNNDVIKGFVVPKVDPVINGNPAIKRMLKNDSQNLKQFNDNYVFFRGASTESQAINISADVLKIDELDRSDQKVVQTFESRTDYSQNVRIKRFSNPSSVGFGVDALFADSDQRHWFITCSHCGHEWYIDFYKDASNCHYVDQERQIYACGKCDREIYTEDRVMGRWVIKFKSISSKRHGYWFSQMMSPWFDAPRIIRKFEDVALDVFYNFTLGKAYTPEDMIVNRETILRACAPSTIPKLNVAMGVDQNANEQIWVAGTAQGIFAHGRTKSWEEFENLKLRWNAVVVADPNPYPVKPKQLAAKYSDFYICYFQDQTDLSLLKWVEKESKVFADRTRILDTVANEITEARLLFREHPYALEDYIEDWGNLYRTTIETPDGRKKSTWLKKDGKQSDFSFATAYMRIALSRLIGGGESTFIDEQLPKPDNVTYTARMHNGQTAVETNFDTIVEDTFSEMGV